MIVVDDKIRYLGFQEGLRKHLTTFTQRCFLELCPADRYRHNWHIDAIAWHLEHSAMGGITRLIITMPPRSLKSITGSVAFPAWTLGNYPHLRFLMASYSAPLAAKHARDCRKVMQSSWFREAFPQCRLDRNKSGVFEFETTRGGSRLSTSVGGTVTGRGGDIIVIDDPIKPDDAMSDSQREAANQWFDGTLYSLVYGKAISVHVDPIEKKPLFHLLPGSLSFSIATVGCNLTCRHCQNADISQMPRDRHVIQGHDVLPGRAVEMALEQVGCGE